MHNWQYVVSKMKKAKDCIAEGFHYSSMTLLSCLIKREKGHPGTEDKTHGTYWKP